MATAHEHFSGFEPAALRLLADLAKHNDRAWFAPRKERFATELLTPLALLVRDASTALERAKIPIGGSPQRSVFRLYRDVRFSNDKSPYKTHVSAYLSYDGERGTPGGVYVHVQPGGSSFLSVAFYRIERPMLQRWRSAMADRPGMFERVLRAVERRGVPLIGPDDDEDSLARMPRGFEHCAGSTLAPYFRLKNFCVHRALRDADLHDDSLVQRIVDIARDARPLLDFGWSLV